LFAHDPGQGGLAVPVKGMTVSPATTGIRIDSVSRAFGAVQAVQDVSLEVEAGEFFTLLGPSGCGKTTMLRMVAGFCDLDRGAIHFGDRRVDTLPPHRRNTGMVFQNYAIFPNYTVAGNVAYGLRARGIPTAEVGARVRRALKLVHLDGYEERWPHQLSGGQLQRVALARCLVIEPKVLLLDEPLSNLDAQLRIQMRAEIRQLQQSLRITALYVTHDQEEALAISDRIGVMRAGRLEQVGSPWEVYRRPATPFVAEFIGATNLLRGVVVGQHSGWSHVKVGAEAFVVPRNAAPVGGEILFSLRPEAIRVLPPGDPPPRDWAILEARLSRIEFLGALTRFELTLTGGTALRAASIDIRPEQISGAQGMVRVAYDPTRVSVFAPPAAPPHLPVSPGGGADRNEGEG
jgi:ABC-type Fe3+/spermidine/putrescine transport system ATPase subunit